MGTLRDRLTEAAFDAGWGLVRRLPEPAARRAFRFGADIAWRRQGGGVQTLEGNLVRVLGGSADPARGAGAAVDGKELRLLSRDVMRSYARYYLETFRLQEIPAERIDAGMHVNHDNVDLTLKHLREGRGVIYALPHMGNFEQAGLWVIGYGAGSFTTVAERLEPESVYEKFLAFRTALGMEVLPTTGGPHPFGVMAQRLRAGRLVCIVADRDLSDTAVEVDFLGETALFPAGPAALAVQTGAALMPVTCWFVGDEEWAAHVHDEIPVPAEGSRREKAAAMTQALADVFAGAIREHPEDWHMLQKLFVSDLDPARLARVRGRRTATAGSAPAAPTVTTAPTGTTAPTVTTGPTAAPAAPEGSSA